MTKKQPSTHALAAKMVKAEIKAKFPKTKIRTQTKSYAGGTSLTVYVGECIKTGEQDYMGFEKVKPSKELAFAKELVKKYQYGHFNSMVDIYEYTNDDSDLPQVKYTFAEPYEHSRWV